MTAHDEPLLDVSGLTVGYNGGVVLQDLSLSLSPGESLAVLGRNGAGKTTLVNSIMGMVRPSAGRVAIDGVDLTGRRPHVLSRAGVAIVPQGRRIFLPLTVQENLAVAQRSESTEWPLERVLDLMPRLKERYHHLGSQLSGGEQQMLAIARALLGVPRLLLLDEPSDGLAPAVVDQVATVLHTLLETGIAALVVEQNLRLAFAVAERVAVIVNGGIAHEASVSEFRRDPQTARHLLGV